MNGHLQLSISLKNHDEIRNGISLLLSLLPDSERNDIRITTGVYERTKRELTKHDYTPVARGELVTQKVSQKDFDEYNNELLALNAVSPSNYGKKGMKEMMDDSKKLLEKRGIINKLSTAKFNPPPIPKDRKYAYNQYGRFLRKKKVSK